MGAAAGILAFAGFFLLARMPAVPFAEAASIGQGVRSFDELSKRFETIAKEKGGLYAYEVLRRAKLPPDTDLHLLGHAVGDILYTQEGVGGIAGCTQDFRNACSHSIVIGTLQEYGPGEEALALIDDSCHKAPGGSGAYTMCYHGLGHGVFAYFGYDLDKTNAFCKRMGTEEYHEQQYTECMGGAIMELMGGGGHDPEQWRAARTKYLTKDPLAPCTNPLIPEEAKGYCYIYLTPRLLELAGAQLAHPDPSSFPRAFSYCDAIPKSSQPQRDSCFGGFGKEFVPLAAARDIRAIDAMTDSDYALAGGWCLLSAAQDGQRACIRQELESVFWGGENDPAASFRFCAVAPEQLRDDCYRRLAQNIRRYLPDEKQKEWCGLLAAGFQEACKPGAEIFYE